MKRTLQKLVLASLFCSSIGLAASITATVYPTQGDTKKSLGTIKFTDSKTGLLIQPHLTSLPPGSHGFHIHVNPDCGKNGEAAGGHFDPKDTQKHLGPNGDGHLGDLPALMVDKDGTATTPVIAPHLTVAEVKKHSVMIHAGGDNYSDMPLPLGGGGMRIACGIIK